MQLGPLSLMLSVTVAVACGGSDNTGSSADADIPGDGASDADSTDARIPCDDTAAVAALHAALDEAVTDADFTLLLRDSDGRNFSHSVGASLPDTMYESASSSKWVAAMTILRLVDSGVLALSDQPQDHISFWTTEPASPHSLISLEHLLSFTSGLEKNALCTNLPGQAFADCVETIYDRNLATPVAPGTGFYYQTSHLQVAGLMAVNASAKTSWAEVFADFKTSTGLFPNGTFDLPSATNPRLAGGMHWRGDEYLDFLDAFYNDQILSGTLKALVVADHTEGVVIKQSPALDGVSEDWHYGFGFWLECAASTYNCTGINRISSPGAFGAYPFIDYQEQYFGILARQGALGSFPEGKKLFDTVSGEVEAWAACRP